MTHDRLWQHEQMRREQDAKPAPALLPLMTEPQPDKAERMRLAVQAIPFALPAKRSERPETLRDRLNRLCCDGYENPFLKHFGPKDRADD